MNICESVEKRFEGTFDSPIFKNIELLRYTFAWPIMGDYGNFGIKTLLDLQAIIKLLETNSICIEKLSKEWLALKTYVIQMIKNCQETKTRYQKIWQTDFPNT